MSVLLDSDKVVLPPEVGLTRVEEDAMRERLALAIHQSMCWRSGTPTPDGYQWDILEHEPGAQYERCGEALEALAAYGNWRVMP